MGQWVGQWVMFQVSSLFLTFPQLLFRNGTCVCKRQPYHVPLFLLVQFDNHNVDEESQSWRGATCTTIYNTFADTVAISNKLAKLGDAIAISNLKLWMTHWLTHWQGLVLGDAIASKKETNLWNQDSRELPKTVTHENCQKGKSAEAAVHGWRVLAANWATGQ